MPDFIKFRDAVNTQFKRMAATNALFCVDLDRDQLWDAYLSAFPEGTNPIYKERTEHDCNCCKHFIRDIGAVVAIKDGKLMSVWDIDLNDDAYQIVADALSEVVKNAPIKGVFRHDQSLVGKGVTRQLVEEGTVLSWNHFEVRLPDFAVARNGDSVATEKGAARTDYQVLKSSLDGISQDAIETVMDLISQNSLYRGQEHLATVKGLSAVKRDYDAVVEERAKDRYLWKTAGDMGPRGRFKNTVIGTLLTDLSSGIDLEDAVKMFESKVAPHNYKRPTALITAKMIDDAERKVEALGIEAALHRRFANEGDLTINNVLFADRSAKGKMKDGVFADLKPTASDKAPSLDKVQEMGINEFIANVLTKAESLELYVENRHSSNLVSLVAPVHDDAPNILKWDNNFSWSYNGEVTDSIKERVKRAGGNVTADVRVSLSWYNYDDLDIHVKEPSGNEIFFGSKYSRWTGGHLDVDMNAGGGSTREPVENIVWENRRKMTPGSYQVIVNNYSKRESTDVGFEVEVEIDGQIFVYHHKKAVRNGANVDVLEIVVNQAHDVSIGKEFIASSRASREVWGISTEQFVKAKMVMNSPNHWDDQTIGNKHWFFILEECRSPDKARGFYNEFLMGNLEQHRKVFEVLGSKMKAEPVNDQLSGIGFSSTQPNSVLCKVSGSFNRTVKINF